MGGSEALYVASGGVGYIYFLIMTFDLNFLLPETSSYQFLSTYILLLFF